VQLTLRTRDGKGDDADPDQQIVTFTLNVTDLPPAIEDVYVEPRDFEVYYDVVNISATITDNFDVSMAWLNITLPNNTVYIKYMGHNDSFYYSNYSTDIPGLYVLRICANDSKTLEGCIAPINLTANSNTSLKFLPNRDLVVDNARWLDPVNLTLNYTIRNARYSRAFNVTANYTSLNGWNVNPDSANISLLLKQETYNDTLNIEVPPGTSAGNYTLQVLLNWTNLDNTTGLNDTNFTIEVLENPLIESTPEEMNFTIINRESKNNTLFVESAGNVIVNDVNVTCYAGLVCENMSVNVTPGILGDMPPGTLALVDIKIGVPEEIETGLYQGHIFVNGTESWDYTHLWVRVPLNISWEHSPTSIYQKLIQDESGEFGVVRIKNTGNVLAKLWLNTSGNITSYISINETYLEIPIEEEMYVRIDYDTPSTYDQLYLTGYFISENTSANITQQTTFLETRIHPLRIDIIEPTETNPVINVTNGTHINVTVSATYGYSLIQSGITFNASLRRNDTYYDVNESYYYNSSDFQWHLNFTAPTLNYSIGYDLVVTGNYSLYDIAKTDIEDKAVIYVDTVAPVVDGTTIKNYDMQLNYKINDTYEFILAFNETWQEGTYGITAEACDHSDNCASDTGQFTTFPYAQFYGRALDLERSDETPINITFDLYEEETMNLLWTIWPNETGYYNETIDARIYDIDVGFANVSVKFYQSPIFSDVYNPVKWGRISSSLIGKGSLVGVEIVENISFETARITFSYAGYEGIDASKLAIYRCDDWRTFYGCNDTWDRLNNSVLESGVEQVYIVTDDLEDAYALAEYVCGNGICELAYGESLATCPQDCPGGAAGEEEGAGAGGGGGGGAEGITPGPAAAEKFKPVPIEFNAPVIDITVYPGETKVFGVDVMNNMDNSTTGRIYAEGPVWTLLEFQFENFTVENKSTKTIQIKVVPPGNVTPGVYTGDIVIEIAGIKHRIPASVAVEILQEPLLDVKVKTLTNVVHPGEDLRFEVTLINMGGTEEVEDIVINYSIRTLEGDTVLITIASETVAVENLNRFVREVTIPENAPQGRYVIEAVARYWYGRKTALSTDSFNVVIEPAPIAAIRRIFSSWVTWVVFFMLLPLGFFVYKWVYPHFLKWREKQESKQRYTMPLDMEEMPKEGGSSVKVGKVAGTDIDAWLDLDDLMTHAIVAGATGSGKTVSAMVVAEEALLKNKAIIVFDPTAQWSGFLAPDKDKKMMKHFARFGLKEEDARPFKGLIFEITDPAQIPTIDFKEWIRPGEITVFTLNKLTTSQFDATVRNIIATFFKQIWEESAELKVLIVFDEVHRLLEKYGGKGGYVSLEKAAREFRKWGLGLMMVSQVLSDFKEAVKGNVLTELQMHSKGSDIERVRSKYGDDYAERLLRQEIGVGFLQNPKYNKGKPWFVNFRPLLHSPHKLLEEELETYKRLGAIIWAIRDKIKIIKEKGQNTADIEMELKLAEDKLKTGAFRMAEIYLEGLKKRTGVTGKARVTKKAPAKAEVKVEEPAEAEAPAEEKEAAAPEAPEGESETTPAAETAKEEPVTKEIPETKAALVSAKRKKTAMPASARRKKRVKAKPKVKKAKPAKKPKAKKKGGKKK
jgi:uncharacterized membrane protein